MPSGLYIPKIGAFFSRHPLKRALVDRIFESSGRGHATLAHARGGVGRGVGHAASLPS